MDIFRLVLEGLVLIVVIVAVILFVDIQKKRIYKEKSFLSAVRQYLTIHSIIFIGFFFKRSLNTATKKVARTQEAFLLKQLKASENTEYGKLYNFASIKSADEYIQVHPLTQYTHYAPYVERMMSGEENVLTKTRPVIFAVTSGTSGTPSIIPMTKKQRGIFFLNGISVFYKYMVEAFPYTCYLNKDLKFFYNPLWRTSASGIKIGPNSSTPSESKGLLHMYSTPEPAFDLLSEPDALYIHLLFGLKDRHIGTIEANFASIIFNAFNTLMHEFRNLAEDVKNGTLNEKLTINTEIRQRLQALLNPDPERAEEIKNAFKEGVVGLAKRLWPELHITVCADTGSFTLYGKKLRETYLSGVPLYSPIYGASEGLLGINIWPEKLPSRYLLHPQAQFFEMIPIDDSDQDQPQTLLLHQVKPNQLYELVITNPSCLYRYRLGDVVKVVDFYDECPIVEFMYRQGQFLNLRGEKTSESLFYDALMDTLTQWDSFKLGDYCCAESIMVQDSSLNSLPEKESPVPCYHLFLELENVAVGTEVSLTQRKMVDQALCAKSYVYLSFRNKGSIGEMQVHIVEPGTFKELRDFTIKSSHATSNQYKVPRVLKKKETVKFMLQRVV